MTSEGLAAPVPMVCAFLCAFRSRLAPPGPPPGIAPLYQCAPLDLLSSGLRRTGAPDKRYRGARQALPGRPTKTTGVPNKNYRGPRQALPGRPTKITGVPNKRHPLKLLQNAEFLVVFRGPFVFVSLVVLCCLTTTTGRTGRSTRGDRSRRTDALPGVLDAG